LIALSTIILEGTVTFPSTWTKNTRLGTHVDSIAKSSNPQIKTSRLRNCNNDQKIPARLIETTDSPLLFAIVCIFFPFVWLTVNCQVRSSVFSTSNMEMPAARGWVRQRKKSAEIQDRQEE
jgi:hypothetical protein